MSAYRWQTDLIDRHSLTLVGPEGWLAHVLRDDDGTWYGYTCELSETMLIEREPDVRSAMDRVYALVARCNLPRNPPCDSDRAPHSQYCAEHGTRRRARAKKAA